MMKRGTIVSLLVFTILSGCKSVVTTFSIPEGTDNTINVIAKKGVLNDGEMQKWSHADIEKDSIAGISLEKAYEFIEDKKGTEVIVGIIDSGVDIEHEDLKNVKWINEGETAGNKIDDDNNGYSDDVFGWNFLGSKDGEIVNADQLEITRIVKKGIDKFGEKKASEIANADKEEFEKFLKLKEEYTEAVNKKNKEKVSLKEQLFRINQIENNFSAVKKFIKKDTISLEDLKGKRPNTLKLAMQISDVVNLLNNGATEESLVEYKKEVLEALDEIENGKHFDLDFNKRQSMGDDLYNLNDLNFGNNNVIGSKALESHGTHVAGIVAASRDNSTGMNGVAKNVKILTARVVPDGDEHDKDVALGIRYAVDNGAKVINMSFGKGHSPNVQWVLDAIKYAAEKDVLLINAAGNDGANIDEKRTFPNDAPDLINEVSDNVLTVGANSLYYDERLPASFSNYGKINVDIFAPGVDIYSTIPSNEYKAISGTSMAAPTAAGVAALIRSYYPQLSASNVKHIIMNSGVKVDFDVIKPGTEYTKVPFSELSVSGRIVNAYNALKMADRIVNGR